VSLVDDLITRREKKIEALLDACYRHITRLSSHGDEDNACESKALGQLIKGLRKRKLWPKRLEPQDVKVSPKDLCTSLLEIDLHLGGDECHGRYKDGEEFLCYAQERWVGAISKAMAIDGSKQFKKEFGDRHDDLIRHRRPGRVTTPMPALWMSAIIAKSGFRASDFANGDISDNEDEAYEPNSEDDGDAEGTEDVGELDDIENGFNPESRSRSPSHFQEDDFADVDILEDEEEYEPYDESSHCALPDNDQSDTEMSNREDDSGSKLETPWLYRSDSTESTLTQYNFHSEGKYSLPALASKQRKELTVGTLEE